MGRDDRVGARVKPGAPAECLEVAHCDDGRSCRVRENGQRTADLCVCDLIGIDRILA